MAMNRNPNRMYSQPPMNSPRKDINAKLTKSSNRQFAELAGKGMDGLSKTLSNVQQVLHVIQSTAPIVQEYGPMIKNLPAMYRMMKAFKEIDKAESTSNSSEKMDMDNTEKEISKNIEIKNETIPASNKKMNGQSTPKLYI